MKLKLLAIGNVLMEDDGIGVVLAKELMNELLELGLTVVIGETDLDYSLSRISKKDYLIVLDATAMVPCGAIVSLPLEAAETIHKDETQHSLSFLHICRLYYPGIQGILLGIGINSCSCHYGISEQLYQETEEIKRILLQRIIECIQEVQ